MPGAAFTAGDDRTRAASAAGVEARQRKAEPLELPAFDSIANVQTALERLAHWGVAGRLPATMVGSTTRACEAWLKCEAHSLDLDRMKALERRIGELETELAAARAGSLG